MSTSRLLVAVAVFLSFIGPTACVKNYVTKKREIHLISQKTEIEIGRKAKEEIVKEYGIYKDIDWQIYVDQVGQRLAKASDRSGLAYDFTILDTDVLNAFAVPGGFVFITRGLLAQMSDEAELAVVLGHEITHIAAYHGIEMLQRAGLLSTLLAIGTIGGIALGAGEAAIALSQAAGVYSNLYLLGYGRGKELEADRYGILYSARAGYDPEASLTFFKRLQKIEKEEEAGRLISPYWRTHPDTEERLTKAQQWISAAPQSTIYNRDRFQAMVSRLTRGEAAEKGVVIGAMYDNQKFGVKLMVPKGWQLDNSRIQSLVGFAGPAPYVRGNLQRFRLPQAMGIDDFGKQVKRQWGIPELTARQIEYPAGFGLLWQYGGGSLKYRSLLVVRGKVGYALTCQIPKDDYLQYVIDCERIMRSFEIK